MRAPATQLNKTAIISWCLFDWAISPFSVLITTFVFATYFTEKIAINKIIGTTQWGEANGLAGLIIALLSPIFGAISDCEGRRKPWLGLLVPIMCVASAALWFIRPGSDYVSWALLFVIIGTIAEEICAVFYNSMLNDLAPKSFLGRLSGWGWGSGYIGGLAALLLALNVLIFNKNPEAIRFCGPLVAIWAIVFSWPLFVFIPDHPSNHISYLQASRSGFKSLANTLRLLKGEYKNILIFLMARMLYIDGLVTVFAFGGIYAAGVFNMTMAEVIGFGISMNAVAGLGAAIFGWLDDKRGPKLTILLTLLLILFNGLGILVVQSKLWFWILGMGLSLGIGPVQAASRSLLIRISPQNLITELFGLYNFSGKATSFLGPWILGWTTGFFKSQRIGLSTVFFMMAAGGILLTFVKQKTNWRAVPDK